MAIKLKLIAKQIPWSLAFKTGCVVVSWWWGGWFLFLAVFLVAFLIPIFRVTQFSPAFFALLFLGSLPVMREADLFLFFGLIFLFFVARQRAFLFLPFFSRFFYYLLFFFLAHAFFSAPFVFLDTWFVLSVAVFSIWFGSALFSLLNLDMSRYQAGALFALFSTFSLIFGEFLFVTFLIPVSVYFQAGILFLVAICLAEYTRMYLLPRHLS
jgi:hypothetical protein